MGERGRFFPIYPKHHPDQRRFGSSQGKSEKELGRGEVEHRAEVPEVKANHSHHSRAELGLGWCATAQRRTYANTGRHKWRKT